MNLILTAIVQLITALLSDSSSPLYFTSVASTPHGIRRVFFGDPQQIPNDDFPAVVVRPVSSVVQSEGTRSDRREHRVEVVIIENLRNYSETTPTDPSKVQSLVTMMNIMESSDANQKVSGSSVVGKLLANTRLPYTVTVGQATVTRYAAIAVHLEAIDYVFNTSRGFPTFETIAVFRVLSQGDRA